MDEKGFLEASRKGEDKHQGIVESEAAHVVVAIQGATAVAEVLVGQQQAAFGTVDVFDDVLIAAIVELVNDGVAVSRIKGTYPMSFLLGIRTQGVVDEELKKNRTLQSIYSEGFE